MRTFNLILLSTTMLTALMVPGRGDAQTQPPAAASAPAPAANGLDQPQSDDIIVTAQKRSENINKVPLSIQAFAGDTLAKAGITDTSALTAVVPGLTFARSGLGTPIYTLRGVGFNTRNLSATSPVGVYTNEVSLAYPYMSNGPLFDVERVEVLKGPQGTLYGRNTTGGLINFITARPTKSLEGSLSATYASYKTYNFDGFVSGPLTDTLGIRLAFRTENSDEGWQRSVTRDDRLGKKSRQALRGSLDWAPTDTISSQFTINYWRDRSDTQAPQASSISPDQPAFLKPGAANSVPTNPTDTQADWDPQTGNKPPFKAHSDFLALSERLEFAFSDQLKLVALTGYNRLNRNDTNEADGTPFEFVAYNSAGRVESFSQELRLQGATAEDRLTYIVGGYYSHDKIFDSETGYVNDASTIGALRFLSGRIPQTIYTPAQIANGFRNFYDKTDQTGTTKSIFGNAEFKMSSTFKINAGLRYTNDRLSARSCSYDYQGNTVPIFNLAVNFLTKSSAILTPNHCLTYTQGFTAHHDIIDGQLNANNLSFRASASYQANSDVLLYASVARGYKSGAFPLIAANLDIQYEPATQERVYSYEAGIKSKLFDRRVQLNVAGFYYDYANKQMFGLVPDPVFTTLNRILNIPRSRVYGIEGEISYRTGGFNFQLNGTLLKSEILENNGFNNRGQPVNFRGKQFTYTPKFQATGSIDYRRSVSATLGVDFNVNGSYQSQSYGDLENTNPYRLKPYFLANASIGLYTTDDRWRISAFVKNIGNEYYYTSADYLRDSFIRFTGMPRTYGLTLTRNFK
ncbi:TonB-dependent receptor [Sphingomonas sp.]|uniref:TonB-dependent receptor n=1 Tax=Sphingomonas sp. TaxID=28214 RepID=UPI003D6D5C21